MKKIQYIKTVLLLVTCVSFSEAVFAFKYVVNVNNVYPYDNSYLQLDSNSVNNVMPSTPTNFYCPYPASPINGITSGQFIYGGLNCTSINNKIADFPPVSPSVTYALYGPDPNQNNKIVKILSCEMAYAVVNGTCQTQVTEDTFNAATDMKGWAKCNAKVVSSTDDNCIINFNFYSPVKK